MKSCPAQAETKGVRERGKKEQDAAVLTSGHLGGIQFVWLSHQQVGDDFSHCKDQRENVNAWGKRKEAKVEPEMALEENLGPREP